MIIPKIIPPHRIAPKGILTRGTMRPKPIMFNFGPQQIKGNPMRDPDKDGFPNAIDCSDNNPRKQGFLSSLAKEGARKIPGIRGLVDKYDEYKRGEPERMKAKHEKRMAKLKYSREEEKEREAISEIRTRKERSRLGLQRERMGVAEKRASIMERRAKAMGSMRMPSLMGGPSLMNPTKSLESPKPTRKRRKKRK